mmetsp:Transcript_38402/g.113906  ORF Transcript_38402/g.113906 Transcript_38402/m.113906 type:complete len:154 (-) Transcript_38402:497-958(-)
MAWQLSIWRAWQLAAWHARQFAARHAWQLAMRHAWQLVTWHVLVFVCYKFVCYKIQFRVQLCVLQDSCITSSVCYKIRVLQAPCATSSAPCATRFSCLRSKNRRECGCSLHLSCTFVQAAASCCSGVNTILKYTCSRCGNLRQLTRLLLAAIL